jgi:hypothetical protein
MTYIALKSLIVAIVATFAIGATAGAPAADTKPNTVFILVDNVGWGDFGVYGGTRRCTESGTWMTYRAACRPIKGSMNGGAS